MNRLIAVALAVLMNTACGSSPSRTTTESTKPADPTPDIGATVQAAIQGTAGAKPAAAPATFAPAPTVAPPAKPTSPPTPSPTPRLEAKLEVTEYVVRKTQFNSTRVVGMIENKGQGPASNIQIAVSLLGEGGATAAAGQAVYKPTVLQPGQKSPWLAAIDGLPEFKEVKIQAQAEPLAGFMSQLVTQNFKIDGATMRPPAIPGGLWKVSGQVTNTGPKSATSVSVIAGVTGPDGKLLEANLGFAKLDQIDPGQSAPFEVDIVTAQTGPKPEKFELYVEGHNKN